MNIRLHGINKTIKKADRNAEDTNSYIYRRGTLLDLNTTLYVMIGSDMADSFTLNNSVQHVHFTSSDRWVLSGCSCVCHC